MAQIAVTISRGGDDALAEDALSDVVLSDVVLSDVVLSDVVLSDAEAAALAATTRGARAARTWRAYESDWADFTDWCAHRRPPVRALPATATTLAAYLHALADAGAAIATIQRRVAALSVAHQLAGHPDQTNPARAAAVRATVAGIARHQTQVERRRPAKATALRTVDLRRLCTDLDAHLDQHPGDLTALRDRAIILIGFAGGFRRSELAQLDVEHTTLDPGGLLIELPWSKTDQAGDGALIGLPYGAHHTTCPVRAWQAWTTTAHLSSGPLFRDTRWNRLGPRLGDRSIAALLHRRTGAADLPGTYSGHSLRAGMATEAYAHGVPEIAVMRHGRWRSATVMRGYVAEGTVWSDNAAARLGL